MRRVLIIAPSFTPSSNPPTHRVRFFARHLPEFGWQPEVLATDPRYYEEPADADIERLVPAGLRVTRAGALPARVTRRLGVGDLGMRTYFPMLRALRTICRERRPDLLLIPGPPWHTFRLGPVAAREFGIPYVLDYIDPWVQPAAAEDGWRSKAYWFRQMALALEPAAVRGASHIVAVSDGTNAGVRARYPELPVERFTGLPYGFEASDFDALRARPRHNPYWRADDGNLHFAYVGAMLPQGYETLRALFAAVRLLRERGSSVGRRLRLHFFGTTYEPNPKRGLVEPHAGAAGIGDIVSEHPARIPYLDALNVLCQADGILGLGSSERHYTASKIFPCILARRPLLAVYHEASSVCEIVRGAKAGRLVTYGDVERAERRVEQIAGALEALVAPGGYDPDAVRWDAFEQYSARNMTQQLAARFDAVLDAPAAERRARGRRESAAA